MRIKTTTDELFVKQLLDIGDGKPPTNQLTHDFEFPPNFCQLQQNWNDVIKKVYPAISRNYKNPEWLTKRIILAPRNEEIDTINHKILLSIPGELKTYRSIDTTTNENMTVNYPTEFLNSLLPSGLPPHLLKLKVNAPVILIRNLNQPKLCNGTRLQIKKLMDNIIECEIMTGIGKGETVLIPRIPMINNDSILEFNRLQFPLRLAYAMTINKVQGQTVEIVGINLEKPCFSHGQLYVACSRVESPINLYIYAPNGKTKNITYPLALI